MGKRRLTSLQPVNVLGVEAQEEPFVVQEPQEIVGVVGPVVARVELLGQSEEGLGVGKEIRQLEDGFWVRDVVLLKVTVEAAPRGPANEESGAGSQDAGRDATHHRARPRPRVLSGCFVPSVVCQESS